MSYPDCRALCAELLDALLSESGPAMGQWSDLIARARAALAQPEAIEPTDEELWKMYDEHCYIHDDAEDPHDWWGSMDKGEFVRAARAVLARWGQPAAAPVPVSER